MPKEQDTLRVPLLSDGTPNCLAGVKLTNEENAAYVEAARNAGLDVHQWVRRVLNQAVAEARPATDRT